MSFFCFFVCFDCQGVLLIFVSEKPPWGVDNKICIVLYCTPGIFKTLLAYCGDKINLQVYGN